MLKGEKRQDLIFCAANGLFLKQKADQTFSENSIELRKFIITLLLLLFYLLRKIIVLHYNNTTTQVK